MRLRYSVLFFLLLSACASLHAQRTTKYCKKAEALYEECITFNKTDGTFAHDIFDGGIEFWTGKGSYKETPSKIFLKYELPPIEYVRYLDDDTALTDSVKIYWYDLKERVQNFFTVQGRDSNGRMEFYERDNIDYTDGSMAISKSLYKPGCKFIIQNSGVKVFVTPKQSTSKIIVHADSWSFHTIYRHIAVLHKIRNGLVGESGRTEKETVFTPRQLYKEPKAGNSNKFTDDTCYRNRDSSPRKLRRNYPFNDASEVKLVALVPREKRVYDAWMERFKDSTCTQVAKLSDKQINDLTDILYNYSSQDSLNIPEKDSPKTYKATHAIVFYDGEGKPFKWLLIDFEKQYCTSNFGRYYFGAFCDGKYDMIKEFMKKNGIVFSKE